MLNNKGFAVSTILYTLLVAFLLFLGVTLSTFSASIRTVGNANTDLIDGTELSAYLIENSNNSPNWYSSNKLIKINSRYGTMYWPRDFNNYNVSTGGILESINKDSRISASCQWVSFYDSGNIEGNVIDDCENVSIGRGYIVYENALLHVIITDELTGDETSVVVYDTGSTTSE